ncbi:MAG: hypothetical protein OJI67_08430, partial [Prosthecobacter sp.]|nr:hypothetical protein [Prosthecobacter sp.]
MNQKFKYQHNLGRPRFIVEDQITNSVHSRLPFHHRITMEEKTALLQKVEEHLSLTLETPPYIVLVAAKLIHAGYRSYEHLAESEELPPKWLELSLLDILLDESVCKYTEKHYRSIPIEFLSTEDIEGQISWPRIRQLFTSPGFQRLLSIVPQRSSPCDPSELWASPKKEGKGVSFHMNTDFKWMNPTQLYTAVHLTYENISKEAEFTFPLHTEQFLKVRIFNNILEFVEHLIDEPFSVTEIRAAIGTPDTTDQPPSFNDLNTRRITIYGPLLNVSPEEPVEHRYPQALRFLFPAQEESLLEHFNRSNTPIDAVPQFCLECIPHSSTCENSSMCSMCSSPLHDELDDLLAPHNWPSFFHLG